MGHSMTQPISPHGSVGSINPEMDPSLKIAPGNQQQNLNPSQVGGDGSKNPHFEGRDLGSQIAVPETQHVQPATQGGGRQQFCAGSLDLNAGMKEVVTVEVSNQFEILTRRARSRSSQGIRTQNSASSQRRELRQAIHQEYPQGSICSNPRHTLWLEGRQSQAELIWELGKRCGASFAGGDEEMISRLKALQQRDEAGATEVLRHVQGGINNHDQ